MNCKDLMIDDLVKFAVRHLKVLSVSSCEVKVKDAYGEIFNVRYFSEIYPIPLTEEMLKANGFKFNTQSDELHYRSYHIKQIVVFWRINAGNISLSIGGRSIVIHYVHELQHALRLCGLNDLADNFKI